jgi:hypothetical protein
VDAEYKKEERVGTSDECVMTFGWRIRGITYATPSTLPYPFTSRE